MKIQKISRTINKKIRFYQAILSDPRTPRVSRWLLGVAIAYLLLPFDLIPDWIPLLGQLDDLVIVPVLIYLAMRFVPEEVLVHHRE